jgi:predicted transcriptional regulator
VELQRPLAVITPTVDGDVLAVLARAEAAFTGREVHRLVGRYSEAGVRNVLTRLVEQGVVLVERAGPSYLYRLNRDHLAAPHIVALAGLRAELLERLRQRVGEWEPAPVFAALFGSAARGDMRAGSDIDVLLIRPDTVDPDDSSWTDQVESLVRDVSRWTGNDTRPLEYGDTEALRALKAGTPVLSAIRNEGIGLAGPDRYLDAPQQKAARAETKRSRRG